MRPSRPADESASTYSPHPQDFTRCQQGDQPGIGADYFELNPHDLTGLDPLQQFLNHCGNVEPNTAIRPGNLSGWQGDNSHVQQSVHQYSERNSYGFTNHTESGNLYRGTNEYRNDCAGASITSYNTHHSPHSLQERRSSVTHMPRLSIALENSADHPATPYGAYRGLFLDSNAARDHRHLCTRFGRQPYIHPEDDSSINEVARERLHHVGRIYDAMVRGDRALDNRNSIAVKRWVICAHYKADVIESYAHKVFDCLLDQVKEGFRGWHHNDYVDDERKGEKEDREIDCAGRLDNIIDALEREKTICEDVVTSASQIRMFVNAPIAYAARKYQNRLGNSKRGRTNAAETDPRPVKRRRTDTRQSRARSNTLPRSRDTTPKFDDMSESLATPYFIGTVSNQQSMSPGSACLAPKLPLERAAMSAPQAPMGYRQAVATMPSSLIQPPRVPSPAIPRSIMSPPAHPASRPCNSHHAMMPLAQMSTLPTHTSMPAPPVYHSVPASPDTLRYPATSTSSDTWFMNGSFSDVPNALIDPQLTSFDPWTSDPYQESFLDPQSTNYVNLVDVEHAPMAPAEGDAKDAAIEFESCWNAQDGVQPFSFGGSVGDATGRF